MRTTLAVVAFAIALPALATSDGYVEWSEVSFKAEPDWSVHIERQYDPGPDRHSSVSVLEISRNGTAVEVPASAVAQVKDPLAQWRKAINCLLP